MDAASRREARRRRILENSETRLKRITSVQYADGEEDNSKHSLNSIEPLRYNSYNVSSTNADNSSNTLETEHLDVPLFVKETVQSTEKIIIPTKTVVGDFQIFIIIGIAFLTNFLWMLCTSLSKLSNVNIEFVYLNKIFIPFLSYKIVDLIIIKSSVKENVLLNTLLLLGNIPPGLFRTLIKTANIFITIMQDMFLYLFVFIMVQVCFSFGGFN